jgi:hypothetical protein
MRGLCALLAGLLACAPLPPPNASEPAGSPGQPPVGSEAATVATARGTSTPTDDPGLPSECAAADAPVCTPPEDFVDRMCKRSFQDVALALFARGTPFTRGYLRGKLDELGWDEEVLIVRFRAPKKGGVIVGRNLGTYDLLRWDGSCSQSVESEMVTRVRPASPKFARIRWNRIGTRTQDALVAASGTVKGARTKRGKECKGVMTGEVTAACDQADDALTSAVVAYVHAGGALPPPDDMP